MSESLCPCSNRPVPGARFDGMERFRVERDTLFNIVTEARVVSSFMPWNIYQDPCASPLRQTCISLLAPTHCKQDS